MLDRNTKELLKHGKNYISASIFVKGFAVISIPILTRLLSPSEYGLVSIFSSLSGILLIIYGLGIRGSISRYYYEKSDDFYTFFSSNAILLWISGLTLSLITFFLRDKIALMVNVPPNVVVLSITFGFCASSYTIVESYYRASKQSKKISFVSVIRATMALLLTVILTLYLNKNKYYGPMGAQVTAALAVFIYSIIVIVKKSHFNIKFTHLRYSLVFGIPVVFHLLSSYILNSFDQIMINKMIGTHETGLYSFAYKVGMLFQIVVIGLNQSWTPIFYQKIRDHRYEEITITVKKYSQIVSGIALLFVTLAPVTARIFAPSNYLHALPTISIIVMGFMFQFFYFMYIGYAFYEKKTVPIAIITIVSGLINIGLNYIFIPKFGYIASAWTTLFTFFILFLLHYLNVKLIVRPPKVVSLFTVLPPGIISLILIVISFLLNNSTANIQTITISHIFLIAIYGIYIKLDRVEKTNNE